jgi:hypothetical protein
MNELITELLNNPELPESIKGNVQQIAGYVSVLESHRALLLDAVVEAGLTNIVPNDILIRIATGEFGNA